jgi:hypothetical protein
MSLLNIRRSVAEEGSTTQEEREFLVLGHPRSGTGYLSRLFRAYGFDVGHEKMGRHGISSWMFAACADTVPFSTDGSVRADFCFRNIVHVTRDPLTAIASIRFIEDCSDESRHYRRQFILICPNASPVEQAVQSWIGWNRLITAQRPSARIRLENAQVELGRFLKQLEYIPKTWRCSPSCLPGRNYNARSHAPLTWRDIKSQCSNSLYSELVEYAAELGYRVREAAES